MSLQRRDLLKGISLGAGSLLLTPIVSKLTAQAAGSAIRPQRFVFVVESNGFTPQQARQSAIRESLAINAPWEDMTSWLIFHSRIRNCRQPLNHSRLGKTKSRSCKVSRARFCSGGHSTNFQALGCFGVGRGGGDGNTTVGGETIDGALAKAKPGIFPFIGLGISKRVEIRCCITSRPGPRTSPCRTWSSQTKPMPRYSEVSRAEWPSKNSLPRIICWILFVMMFAALKKGWRTIARTIGRIS